MLLRRLIDHVKTQNWTAVVLDFFIVVFGVFIGIQVDNWNQGRIAQHKEREYLELLMRDLENDLVLQNTLKDGISHHVQAIAQITRAIEGSSTPNSELEIAFTYLFLTWDYFPPAPTYAGLRNGAQLDIFRDAMLRGNVIDYYEIRLPDFKDGYVLDYNQAHDTLRCRFPNYARMLGPCSRERAGETVVYVPIPDDLDFTTLLKPITDAKRDISFLNAMAEVEGRGTELLAVMEELQQSNRRLQSVILDYLN